jgi:peptide/nickel transport system substrate-binding protein
LTRRTVVAGSSALGVLAASGFTVTRPAAALGSFQDDAETVQVRVNADIESIDPAYIGSPPEHAVGLLVYSGLARYAPGTVDPMPDLATEWDISDDGLVYTFTLREGVQWQKGYGEFTANDVIYSFNRIADPETASAFQGDMERVESIEALDDYTVQITLTEPFAPFLSGVIAFRPGWIVNQRAIEEKGDAYGLDPIGTGPYMWENRAPGTEVVLTKHPEYYEPLDIETVRVKFIIEDSVAELALQSGELDVTYLYQPESSQRALEMAGSGFGAKQIAAFRTQWAGFNLSRPAVQDIRVRQAIIHAIDKPAAAQAVAGELAQVVSSIFNPNINGYIDPDPFAYDPDLARQLLSEAGFADGLDLEVLVIPSSTWPDLATVVQEQWRQVGINANLLTVERAVYDEMMGQADAPFDIATVNITRSEPYQYAAYFLSSNIPDPNVHNYSNPEVDEIVAEATRTADTEEQAALWEQFQQIVLVDDVVGFGMTNVNYVIAWNDQVANVDNMYVDSYPVWQMSIE